MYEEFYGFWEKPFSLLPDPAFFYPSRVHRRALTMLQYGLLNEASFIVITGEIGSGKTTLVRTLRQQLNDSFLIGLVSNTQCSSFEELLAWILVSFGIDTEHRDKVSLLQQFTDFLNSDYARERRVVLVVDEAQHLSVNILEELRMLSNINVDKDLMLQLILVGQPNLRDVLRRPELVQFIQRVFVDYHIRPLTMAEAKAYVKHRLEAAGATWDVFHENAYPVLWKLSRGIPRLINLLCDTALVYGFAEQVTPIEKELILEVARDRRSSLAPLAHDEASPSRGHPSVAQSVTSSDRRDGGFTKSALESEDERYDYAGDPCMKGS